MEIPDKEWITLREAIALLMFGVPLRAAEIKQRLSVGGEPVKAEMRRACNRLRAAWNSGRLVLEGGEPFQKLDSRLAKGALFSFSTDTIHRLASPGTSISIFNLKTGATPETEYTNVHIRTDSFRSCFQDASSGAPNQHQRGELGPAVVSAMLAIEALGGTLAFRGILAKERTRLVRDWCRQNERHPPSSRSISRALNVLGAKARQA